MYTGSAATSCSQSALVPTLSVDNLRFLRVLVEAFAGHSCTLSHTAISLRCVTSQQAHSWPSMPGCSPPDLPAAPATTPAELSTAAAAAQLQHLGRNCKPLATSKGHWPTSQLQGSEGRTDSGGAAGRQRAGPRKGLGGPTSGPFWGVGGPAGGLAGGRAV